MCHSGYMYYLIKTKYSFVYGICHSGYMYLFNKDIQNMFFLPHDVPNEVPPDVPFVVPNEVSHNIPSDVPHVVPEERIILRIRVPPHPHLEEGTMYHHLLLHLRGKDHPLDSKVL